MGRLVCSVALRAILKGQTKAKPRQEFFFRAKDSVATEGGVSLVEIMALDKSPDESPRHARHGKDYRIFPAHSISQKSCQGSIVIWDEIFLGRCSFEMIILRK